MIVNSIRYVNENFKTKFANSNSQNGVQKAVVSQVKKPIRRLKWKIDNNALTAIECASAQVSKLIQVRRKKI